jgi:hypothetical protein
LPAEGELVSVACDVNPAFIDAFLQARNYPNDRASSGRRTGEFAQSLGVVVVAAIIKKGYPSAHPFQIASGLLGKCANCFDHLNYVATTLPATVFGHRNSTARIPVQVRLIFHNRHNFLLVTFC